MSITRSFPCLACASRLSCFIRFGLFVRSGSHHGIQFERKHRQRREGNKKENLGGLQQPRLVENWLLLAMKSSYRAPVYATTPELPTDTASVPELSPSVALGGSNFDAVSGGLEMLEEVVLADEFVTTLTKLRADVIVNPPPGSELRALELEVAVPLVGGLVWGGGPIGNVVFEAGHPDEASRRTGH